MGATLSRLCLSGSLVDFGCYPYSSLRSEFAFSWRDCSLNILLLSIEQSVTKDHFVQPVDFLVIHRLLQTAKQAEESKNFRQASRIYEKILSAIPVQTEAARQCLDSLTRLWLSVGRPVQALRWCRTLIQEFLQNAAALELLGDCLSHPVATQSELKEALLAYRRASGLATNQADVTRLLLAQARVLHRLDNSSTKAEASAIIMEVISKDSQNWEALYQYARVAKDREMTSDAIRVLLRLLVERPSHPGVRCMLAEVQKSRVRRNHLTCLEVRSLLSCVQAVAPPGNISLLIKELHGDAHTDAALAFLATCLKVCTR